MNTNRLQEKFTFLRYFVLRLGDRSHDNGQALGHALTVASTTAYRDWEIVPTGELNSPDCFLGV